MAMLSSRTSVRSRMPLAQPGRRTLLVLSKAVAPGDTVLVVGATGGIGQLVTAKLLERGYKVRAMTRSTPKAAKIFGNAFGSALELVEADCRTPDRLRAVTQGMDAICCATGTTAFPSKRWDGDNGPEATDLKGNQNLIAATPRNIKRFVFVTSAGVERQGSLPWAILNLFGVLKFKRQSEQLLEASGLPYTIIRPSRLTDGPYTSFDLNTLLKSTAGTRRDVTLSATDSLFGEASRIATAEAVVQSLALDVTENKKYAISSVEGDGPGTDASKWQKLCASCK